MAPEHAPRTSPEVGGMGHSIKRKEDPRFIRGQGTYVDDVQLPGMLYLDIVRSPYAHAKITKIDTAKALAIPGVLAVITGQDLAKYNLHWMPTLMSDTQMVLPVEKVMYQAQEVAAVLATERYIAADGADAVEVQYEPLPVVVDPKKALEPGRPRAPHRQEGQERQPHLALGVGRPGRHRPRVPRGGGHRQGGHLPPSHPRRLHRDLRVRRPVRQGHREADGLDDYPGPPRDPHGVRARGGTRGARGAQDPDHLTRHRRRVRREGAGLPRLRDRGRGVGPHREAREVDRGPDGEPPGGLVRPRLPHHRRAGRDEGGEAHRASHQDHRRPRLHRRRGEPVEVPGRTLPRLHGLLRPEGRPRRGRRRLHEQAAGRDRLPVLVPRHRGRPHHRAHGRPDGASARDGPRGVPPEELRQAGAVSLQVGARLGVRQRRLRRAPCTRRWT